MKKLNAFTGCSLIVLMWATEFHSLFNTWFHDLAQKDVRSWFWKPVDFAITLQWWIKFNSDTLLLCGVFFLFARLAIHFGAMRIFYMACLYFLYFLIDHLLFLYHYKLNYNAYYAMLVITTITVAMIVKPSKKENNGKLVEM